MKKQGKVLLITIIALVIVGSVAVWFGSTHIRINGEFFSISAGEAVLCGEELPDAERLKQMEHLKLLDIRNIAIQPEEYDALQEELPDCEILWQVPVFGCRFDHTETTLSAAVVTAQDIKNMAYFRELKTVDATGCTDYDMLMTLQDAYPSVEVIYTVSINGNPVRENTVALSVSGEDASNLLEAMAYLPKLKKVEALDCSDYVTLDQIKRAYPELELLYTIPVCGESWPSDATQLILQNVDGAELSRKLPYFSALTDVVLTGTVPDHDAMYQLMCDYPAVTFHWEFSVCGVVTSSTATELILSEIPLETVEEVENALKYFYDLQRVEMCQCGISSEEMDDLWKRHPEIRFVWSIPMGKGYLRTDATAFIPYKYGFDFSNPCNDTQTRELKYCVDMVCLDLGHMRMKDLSFLESMPNLKYLILADTQATDYSPVAQLKELIYLELFNSDFRDTELLLNLTKLEDLNVAWTRLKNPDLLKQMTWLKRLWATRIGLPDSENPKLKKALSETEVYTHGLHPTEGGWRQSKNYYDMRDLLGMEYME